jgi:acetyl esterase/lipase
MALVCSFAVLLAARAEGQERRFFYPAPQPLQVRVTKNVPYRARQMDVYRPATDSSEPLPALVFLNAATGDQRSNGFYRPWAEITAAQGVVAILPDLRADSLEADLDAALATLAGNAERLGIDRARVAVYAGSGNVYSMLPIVQNPRRKSVTAAVMYYGAASVTEFRRDLPLLVVRAGLDRPPVNRQIGEMVSLAVTQNAPVTLVNYPGGHHAFEIFDDAAATRAVIDRTIAFVKEATRADYQASLRNTLPEASAAADVMSGRFAKGAGAYGELVRKAPQDARLRLAYGEALLASRFAEACAELEQLKAKGLGPRDLGIPAAHACMQKGDADAAIGWLQSIPKRVRPSELQQDPIFAPIRHRPDFIELF